MLATYKKLLAKMKKHLGFTLVEMLVVIAIIAILVSIITPIVTHSTTKANAAANAANLRSVMGQAASLKATGAVKFDQGETPARVAEAMQRMIDSTNNIAIKSLLMFAKDLISAVYGTQSTYFAEDGKFVIEGVTILAPQAKKISFEGLTLRAGTEMTLTVSDTEIIATYDGLTVGTFALIAAGGDTTSIEQYGHDFIDSNGDWLCDICGKSIEEHSYEDIVGGIGSNSHACTSSDGDCVCDDPNCGQTMPCVDSDGNYNCDRCGKLLDHTHVDNNPVDSICDVENCDAAATHSHTDNTYPKDCVCDYCGSSLHTYTTYTHKCDTCNSVLSHTCVYSGGYCTLCGAVEKTETVCSCTGYKSSGSGIFASFADCVCGHSRSSHQATDGSIMPDGPCTAVIG